MNQDQIKALLEEASENYNQGRFEEAIASWKQVLAVDPASQKAREGIRMASLLVADWDDGSTGQVSTDISQPVAAQRAARATVAAAASGHGEATGAPDLEAALQVGREALAAGRHAEAADAARRALELDPGNMEACGILSLSADDETAAAPVRIDAVAGETASDLAASLDRDITNPQPIITATGPMPAAASVDLSPEDLRRISVILDEGQREFDAGRFQDAISVWSRVFVIDRSNTEAGLRIDRAKAGVEQRIRDVDELYYRAVDAHDANRLDEAVELFTKVLELTPTHPEARAYLDEIKTRASGGRPQTEDFAIDPPAAPRPSHKEETAAMFPEGSVPLADIGLDRPKPERERERSSTRQEFIDRPLGGRKGARAAGGTGKLMIGLTLAIVFAGAGVSAWLYFGNSNGEMAEAEATPAEPPRERPKVPIPEAPAGGGGAPIEVVPGAAPKPSETAPGESSGPAETPAPAPAQTPAPPADTAQADVLAEQGREHYQQGRWAEAALALKKALDLDPTNFETKDLLDKAVVALEKQAHFEHEMQLAGTYFSEQDYASALHKFYRLQQERTDMRVLEACIRNSWYNWGVVLLQSGAVDEAAEKFDEVLQLRPHDREAAAARDVAQRYHKRARDASFNAFAATLTLRPLDEQ